jgi:CopG family transcriptional regulator, nickel-responsive regulator
MPNIISISLNDRILGDLKIVEKHMGFSGRSEALRAGLRMLLADYKEKEKLSGTVNAAIIIVHTDDHVEEFSSLTHKYRRIIKTNIHHHLEGKCLDIIVIKGGASVVREMLRELHTDKHLRFIKMVVL